MQSAVTKRRDYFKEYNRRYHLAHKAEIAARHRVTNRARYLKNKDRILEQSRKYHAEHRDAVRTQQRLYRLANLEERKAHCRAWYEAHKDDPAAKEKFREQRRAYYQENKAKVQAAHKAWRAANRGHWRSLMQKRRALETQAAINLAGIHAWMQKVRGRPTSICYYCRHRFPSGQIHFDHIVPLSKGGQHSVDNLCVACSSCNLTKGAKTIQEWRRVGQQHLPL